MEKGLERIREMEHRHVRHVHLPHRDHHYNLSPYSSNSSSSGNGAISLLGGVGLLIKAHPVAFGIGLLAVGIGAYVLLKD